MKKSKDYIFLTEKERAHLEYKRLQQNTPDEPETTPDPKEVNEVTDK